MVTVVNSPGSGTDGESSGIGLIVGVILAIVIIALFFIYGLPAIRGTNVPQDDSRDINVDVDLPGGNNTPAPGTGGTGGAGTGGTGTGGSGSTI